MFIFYFVLNINSLLGKSLFVNSEFLNQNLNFMKKTKRLPKKLERMQFNLIVGE